MSWHEEGRGAPLDRDAALDGLRGVAVAAVVYVHYLFYSGLSARPGGGHTGVLVFFVLSGYLITRILWGDGGKNSIVPYSVFVRRRVRRLYPALLGVAVIGAPIMTLAGPEPTRVAIEAVLMALGQLTAFFYAGGLFVLEPWLPTWSLTVEWTFYLTWPLVIAYLRRREISAETARRFCFALAAVLYLVAMPLSPRAFYVLPIANLAVMIVGAAIALTHFQRKDGKYRGRDAGVADMAFLLLLVIIFLPSATTGHVLYRITYFPLAVIAACVILDQRPGTRGVVSTVLASAPMRVLGLTSYSIYLWHIPVLWTSWWAFHEVLTAQQRALVALIALVPIVYLSFRFLEQPVLRGHGVRTASTPPPPSPVRVPQPELD